MGRRTQVAWMLAWALAGTTVAARADDAGGEGAGGRRLTYAGRVVDAEGRPVAGATVHAITGPPPQVMVHHALLPWREIAAAPPVEPVGGSRLDTATGPTGADGRFTVAGIRPPAGGFVVVVHPEFRAARFPADPRSLEDGTLDVGDVPLTRGGSLRATVVDEAGSPVAGAWVVVQPRNMPWDRFSPGEIRSARTGADGTCVVAGLGDAAYAAGAFTAAAPPVEHEFAVADGEAHATTFRLRPGGTLRVLARDRVSGAPVAGARVDLVPRPPEEERVVEMGAGPMATARTDVDGVASFPGLEDREYLATVVPPDRYDDHVNHPGAFSVTVTGRPGKEVEVRLDPPVACALSVVDATTGAPVGGLLYEARAEWAAYDRTGGSPVDVRGVAKEPRDPVVVEGLRAGPWRFHLFAQGYHPLTTDVVRVAAGAAPVRVEMRPATAVAEGRVVAGRDGAPVAGARVSAYEWVQMTGDGQRASATSDAAGRFRLAPLLGEGVPLRLEVRADGFVPLVWGQTADARRPDLGDLVLVRAAAIRGVLVDAAGHARPDVEVLLLPSGSRGRGKGEGVTATTDAQGRFAFAEVPPGRHDLHASGAALLTVDVAEGRDVAVRLEPGAPAR